MAEYEGADALLAAITDEPLPEGAEDDAEFMAEYGAATADVALLREQLTVLGDVLADRTEAADPNPVPVSVRAPRKRRLRPLVLTLGTLAVVTVAAVVVGMSWLLAQGGSGAMSSNSDSGAKAEDSGGSSFSAPGYLACSRLVAEGTVARVEQVPGATRDSVTLDVSRYYKPDRGKGRITFLMDENAGPRLRTGDHVLVAIPRDQASPDIWITGEREIARDRTSIEQALPDSRALDCE
ncbi:hypothetical protein [Streptomyces sp. NPDC050535]|uniref:hypothetical protein n=1 Tax=Streptomyces sp. NPDC050535 TaxID=3365626 RepID=UPI003798B596